MITRTQLRNTVKTLNQQLSNSALTNLADRQALVLRREATYTAIRMLQANEEPHSVQSFLHAHGIETAKTSGKDKSTWDTAAFTDYAKRGCNIHQKQAMGFKASRVGNAKEIHNIVTHADAGNGGRGERVISKRKGGREIVARGAGNTAVKAAKAAAVYAEKHTELVKQGTVGNFGGLQGYLRNSELRRGKAYKQL